MARFGKNEMCTYALTVLFLNLHVHNKIYHIEMFTSATCYDSSKKLSTNQCSSIDWINTFLFINTMEYCAAIKVNKLKLYIYLEKNSKVLR